MTRPTKRPNSTVYSYRKRVPSDILARHRGHRITLTVPGENAEKDATVNVKIAETIKVSLRTREPAIARARTGNLEDQLHRQWEALRAGPVRLTQKQTVALAGISDEAARRSL